MKLLLIAAILLLGPLEIATAQPTKPIQRGEYAYLEIMHERQSPDLCLPTCVAMAMNYYGTAKSQWTVKRLSNEHKDLFSGTTLEEICQGIKPLGYTWDRWQWPGDSNGFLNAIHAVEQSLDNGKPVVLEILQHVLPQQPNGNGLPGRRRFYRNRSHVMGVGHALLAFGYDTSSQELFVMDPAMDFPGKRYLSFDELRELWSRDDHYHALFTARLGEMPEGHLASAR
ncbi:MAG TPA: C39 family peptidase [Candidatus Kapabacteria bacterium]|nr:C39 family peptidase [Candidatus Kapabacteria bacterium]